MSPTPIRLGVAGLGLAGHMILSSLGSDRRVTIAAGADPVADSRKAFEAGHDAPAYSTVEELCQDPAVNTVWVATPTRFHREHTEAAVAAGKHVIVEKPMAPSVADCDAMVEGAAVAGVHLIAGGVRSLDPAFAGMREVIDSGAVGRLRHIQVSAHTAWMRRPRTPVEMDVALGGGIVFNQAPHQIDTVRVLLGGRAALSVAAWTEAWSDSRPGVGHYRADLEFEDDVHATLTYDGYGYLLSSELVASGESAVLADAGLVIASGSRGAVRPAGDCLCVVDDEGQRAVPIRAGDANTEAISELVALLERGRPPVHSGEWGRATLEIVIALLESAKDNRRVPLR
jgi:phthalate 4,5-cis-dihydrodiol dehydrogenase